MATLLNFRIQRKNGIQTNVFHIINNDKQFDDLRDSAREIIRENPTHIVTIISETTDEKYLHIPN